MLSTLRTRLAISRLCRAVKRLARARGVEASVLWFGAYWIHPQHLAVIVRVGTDAEKARLGHDQGFRADLQAALTAVGYPAAGREGVGFEVESDETVDRDWNGSWWQRFK